MTTLTWEVRTQTLKGALIRVMTASPSKLRAKRRALEKEGIVAQSWKAVGRDLETSMDKIHNQGN
ncbi:MAG: hypothetical protein Q4P24_16210 [Rhodobacterales bacterium]|nr:hypothetical protein [Rhodobacterales bacterium]